MEHWEKKNNEEAENRFHRLPDDVIVHIFDKVSDIKWLCRCFMASKRFSSLVPRVQTLSVNSNIWDSFLKSCTDSHSEERENPQGPIFLEKFSEFFIGTLVFQPLRYFHDASYPFPFSRLNFLDLVFQLKQIRSLNLELISDFSDDDDSVFTWGVKFTAEIDSFTFLYAKSLSRTMNSEAEEDATENIEIAWKEMFHSVKVAKRCAKYAGWWLGVLSHVFAKFPILESVTITDWKNKGVKLCLGGEKLVECRNTLDTKSMISPKLADAWWREQGHARVSYLPVLQLPITGYVMKGVTFVNFKKSGKDFESNTAMLDAFAEEQGPFLEALEQILEKHKDSIKGFFYEYN
ncbi:F-box protein At4g18380-like [Rhododendron vialii]|uniref:F-box protein At4g18380-like n=1 Tax=Rhododendron vialii TaxID=182163 RepID=UPI00265DA069|nr:F-box protein At4g18380-like [Rhododendron vialii]